MGEGPQGRVWRAYGIDNEGNIGFLASTKTSDVRFKIIMRFPAKVLEPKFRIHLWLQNARTALY